MHYSGQGVANWKKVVQTEPEAFQAFSETVCHEDVMQVAHEVLKDSGAPEPIRNFIIKRLESKALSQTRKMLMFNYKLSFESYL